MWTKCVFVPFAPGRAFDFTANNVMCEYYFPVEISMASSGQRSTDDEKLQMKPVVALRIQDLTRWLHINCWSIHISLAISVTISVHYYCNECNIICWLNIWFQTTLAILCQLMQHVITVVSVWNVVGKTTKAANFPLCINIFCCHHRNWSAWWHHNKFLT
jgi:hypothetical protein